ncbi:hypothetical protein MHYP_G00332860 [Metynnis hypsauchen]
MWIQKLLETKRTMETMRKEKKEMDRKRLQIEKLEQAWAQVNEKKWQVQAKREAEKERHQLQQKEKEARKAQMKEVMGALVKEMVSIKRRFQAEMDSRALEFEREKDNMTNENQRRSTTVTLSCHLCESSSQPKLKVERHQVGFNAPFGDDHSGEGG